MPEPVLYAIISFLGLAVLTLAGLWVRSQDSHRQWATERIAAHGESIAVLQATHLEIRADVKDIKEIIKEHSTREEKLLGALTSKLNIKVE